MSCSLAARDMLTPLTTLRTPQLALTSTLCWMRDPYQATFSAAASLIFSSCCRGRTAGRYCAGMTSRRTVLAATTEKAWVCCSRQASPKWSPAGSTGTQLAV